MTRTRLSRTIDAPVHMVFSTVADISNFSKAVPHIVNVEFLSEVRAGIGARFRETRVIGGRKATADLRITEFVANERVGFVSDQGGAVWETVFTVSPVADGQATRLDMVMVATPHRLLARLMVPLMKKVVAKAIAADLDAVEDYAERQAGGPVA